MLVYCNGILPKCWKNQPGGYWSQMGRNQQLAFRLFTLLSSFLWVQKMQTSCLGPQHTCHTSWLCPGCLFVRCQHLKCLQGFSSTQQSHQLVFQHPIGDGIFFWGGHCVACRPLTRAVSTIYWWFPRIRINGLSLPFKLSFFVRNLPFDVFFQVLHLRFSSMDWILGGRADGLRTFPLKKGTKTFVKVHSKRYKR